ncbi:histidine ABC transporter permease HisM [Brackiella oedipodis]|uniref:histidine ABC transporter permease HisM n=1 Tax=Brackiella oedipodis TaxID=124225 RepID=UPI00048CF401|nr:histidine ABC transporter permease HisM [Brackiella oedipodis]
MSDFLDLLKDYWQPFIYWDGTEWSGLAVTLWVLVVALAIGFCLSLPLSIARVSKKPWLKWPVYVFTYVFRGTPLYIQLLLIYSGMIGVGFIHNNATLSHFFASGYHCLVLSLVLNTMAYTIEMFAGYIRTTPSGEIEAAQAYGMSKFQIYRYLIIPSMLRRALPAYSNEVILMLHSTSLAFTATVPDILKVARDVNSETYLTFYSYGTAALLYMCLAFIFVWLFRLWEKRALAFLAQAK